ncbi:TonB-dependent receptor [Siphonobacter sp. SORGH_AS_0500]|uniref:SusC/RagA family TonB-linked outer membrane protein n=1 Tax=Siphonobacter sp. SORGH_AS_0500 TaxID=1864824 RepID=UPI00285921E1|nr:TonB-dependent receptor [Siphonobacter sp. SORGH_AS_0500]MDR6197148.1 TonB-linked SusC/RagA family outer membrane protein [Siphonobacter sp. SORGH_AS_0500]
MKNLLLYGLLLWGSITGVAAQNAEVTGHIISDTKTPVVGATVRLKGTVRGVISDTNGDFTLKADHQDTLQISAIGYVPIEIRAIPGKRMIITLKDKQQDLSEVVVVGFGAQKKLAVTGAISSVGTKELTQSPVANLSNALAGRLPGLTTLQTSGEPGYDGAQLWIRGMATFSGSQSPLILVDGVERSFGSIDANEVATVSILKDAASTAVYGVRGANGVVLVTTRRGTEGRSNITATVQQGIQMPTRLPEYLDSYDALTLYRTALINDGKNSAMYTDEYLNKFRDRSKPSYAYLYPNVNWLKEMIRPSASMMQANINVSGGTSSVRHFVSLSYLRQNGLYNFADQIKDYDIQARSNRYNFRSNIDLDINKYLVMELNLGSIIRDNNFPPIGAGDIFGSLQAMQPWLYPMTNPDGSISGLDSKAINPYGRMTQGGYQRNFENTLQATSGFTLQLPFVTQGLSLRGRLSFDSYSYRNVRRVKNLWTYQYSLADENETDLSKGTYRRIWEGTNTLSYDVSANSNRRTWIELYANYNRIFAQKHAVTGMLLYNQQSYFDQVGSGYAIAGLPYKYNGFVGRGTYAYNDTYFAEINFGYNGSENFPRGKRYDLFPSMSAGWIMSNESFMKGKLSFVSLLKWRGSVGTVGNDKIGQRRFLYQSTWSLNAGGYQFGRDYNGVAYTGAAEDVLGATNVTWEKALKYNLGMDLGLFNDAFTATADVFYERRKNILAQPGTIPATLGITSLPYLNLGEVENKGFELEAQLRKRFRNINYFIKGNVSYAQNKILQMDEPSFQDRPYIKRTGRSINEQYSMIALGLFQSQEDIDNSPDQSQFGRIVPGDIKYKDMNGDHVINELDRAYNGKVTVPTTMAGLALGFNSKLIDVSILFQGAFGGNVWLTGDAVWPFSGDVGVMADVKDNYWTTDRPNAKYPRLSSSANVNNNQISTYWMTSRNYVRLKNVEIGFTLPKSILSRVGLKTGRFFVNGLNLITWDKLKIFDPEIPNDSRNYPQQKVFNGGLTIGL